MRSFSRSFLLFLLVLSAAACGTDGAGAEGFPDEPLLRLVSQSGELDVEVRTSPQPPGRGTNEALFTITQRETGAPATGLRFTVEPWMPGHGHGSPTVPTVEERGEGDYLVRDIDFTMAGEWELRVRITAPQQDGFDATFHVR